MINIEFTNDELLDIAVALEMLIQHVMKTNDSTARLTELEDKIIDKIESVEDLIK